MLFIPIPLPAKSHTNFQLYYFVLRICRTNCLGHGHGYECHSLEAARSAVPRRKGIANTRRFKRGVWPRGACSRCRCAIIGVPWRLRRLGLFGTCSNVFLTNKPPQAKHAETDPRHGTPTMAHFQPPDRRGIYTNTSIAQLLRIGSQIQEV